MTATFSSTGYPKITLDLLAKMTSMLGLQFLRWSLKSLLKFQARGATREGGDEGRGQRAAVSFGGCVADGGSASSVLNLILRCLVVVVVVQDEH